MNNRNLTIALLLGALGVAPMAALANCKADPGTLIDYEGTIGNKYKIGLSLSFANPAVGGAYFYVSQLKNITLRGTVQDGVSIKLEELDAQGEPSARFDLTASKDCRTLEGSWQKRGAAASLPVSLSSDGSSASRTGNRYWNAGVDDDEIVHRGAARLWRAIKEGDRKTVAAQVRYPVRVTLNGRSQKLRNSSQLLANYDAIFSAPYRDAIAEAVPRNMFSNTQGIMLGKTGLIWFNHEGKVISFNNP